MKKNKNKFYIIAAVLAAIIFFLTKKKSVVMINEIKENLLETLNKYLKDFEGFNPLPYWDVRQWTWGYGTKVPNSSKFKNQPPVVKRITKEAATIDMYNYLEKDRKILKQIITRQLNSNEWAALLLLSYNLGIGYAKKMALLINTATLDVIKHNWLNWYHVHDSFTKTKEADKKLEASVLKRRQKEFDLFIKPV